MGKAFLLSVAAILFLVYDLGNGLECYHCFLGKKQSAYGGEFVQCDEKNLSLSNTWQCPAAKAQCIYETVEIQYTKEIQVWRTCSNGISDPCDPTAVPPGVKMIDCTYCGTDKCNLERTENKNKTNFTFNINANVNLFVRQLN